MNKLFLVITAFISLHSANGLVNCHDSFNPSYDIKDGVAQENNGFNLNKLAQVDKLIETDIKNGFPGAELLVMRNGVIVKHSVYGYKKLYSPAGSKLSNPEPMQCNTEFDLASNTKMYATNYAIQHLVYQGKLNLESPISYYIPEYKGCDSAGHCRDKITVRQVISHMAGYMPDAQFFNPKSVAKYGDGLYSQESNLTKQIILTKLPFANSPGNSPNYSDIDFMLLGILIERITGMPLDEYTTQNIYQPLGLKHTYFNPLDNGAKISNCAATELAGNTRGGKVYFPNIRTNTIQCQVHDEKAYYSMGGVSGHAGLFSTAHDMAVLAQLMLDNGHIGNVTLWDKSITKQFTTPLESNDSYGLGWRLAGNKDRYKYLGSNANPGVFGHTGWVGTVSVIDPKNQLVIILLTNKKHTPIKSGTFIGDKYNTGKYYPIIDTVYAAMNN